MSAKHTPGPWELCRHLESMEADQDCPCGYRGVIFGPEHDVAMAICQPGHQPAPAGEEGTEPCRYPRDVELANARLIAAAPDLLAALIECEDIIDDFVGHLSKSEQEADPDLGAALRNTRAAIAKATNTLPAAVCTAAPQCNPSPQARQDMRATSTVRRAQKGSEL